MYNQSSSNVDQISGSLDTLLSGQQDKAKRIRKDKSRGSDTSKELKMQLSKEQKKEIQKEKNRVAAQLSRDRQKKYLEDLEEKIADLEKSLSSQLCSKCKSTLDNSSTDSEPQATDGFFLDLAQPQVEQLGFMIEAPQIEEVELIRENSRIQGQWVNISRYFCVFMIIISVALISTSVEETSEVSQVPLKQIARILTDNSLCDKKPEKIKTGSLKIAGKTTSPTTMQQLQSLSWPFSQDSIEPVEQCKSSFWNSYLQKARLQLTTSSDLNFVNCNSPHLIHISKENESDANHGKWTFLITNPTVTHSRIGASGGYLVDEVSYLNGVYQMIAEKVQLKKVMGKFCLA